MRSIQGVTKHIRTPLDFTEENNIASGREKSGKGNILFYMNNPNRIIQQ